MFQPTEQSSPVSGSKLWDVEHFPRPAADVRTQRQHLAFEFLPIILKLIFRPVRQIAAICDFAAVISSRQTHYQLSSVHSVRPNSILRPFLKVEGQI